MAFGDSRALKLIYEAASGLERGLQSRRQKKAFIYDTFGALLEMLGKAPVSTRAQFSRSQFEFYLAPFGTPFELHLGSKSRPLVQLSALKACRSTPKQGLISEALSGGPTGGGGDL